MCDLDQVIRDRRSSRMFLPDKQVPRNVIDEAVSLAVCAPSNSNIQPWHMVFASGATRERLVAAQLEAARTRAPRVDLPKEFAHYRFDLGTELCGLMGVAHDDVEPRRVAILRN